MSNKHKALLNNCVDDDEAILHQREIDKDTYICGLCRFYDKVTCFCDEHPEYGKLVEMDMCFDYEGECD